MSCAYKVVLLRHGESEWNKLNKFCGWHDADLSELGVQEAIKAGKMLADNKYVFDVAYTSLLKRATRTLNFVLDELSMSWIPVKKDYTLNERMYGGLQGLNKSETAAKHGEEQVLTWRRSYDIPPPPMEKTNEDWPGHDPRYAHLDQSIIPVAECLKDTVERVLPYWHGTIVPDIKSGKRVLISAHGNSLRGLIMYLDKVSEVDIPNLNVPTGIPLVYELDSDLRPVRHYYLADAATVQAAQQKVANQGKAK